MDGGHYQLPYRRNVAAGRITDFLDNWGRRLSASQPYLHVPVLDPEYVERYKPPPRQTIFPGVQPTSTKCKHLTKVLVVVICTCYHVVRLVEKREQYNTVNI